MTSKLPELYCISMWKSIHIDVDGYLTPCCMHIHEIDKKKRITDVDNIESVLLEDHEEWRNQLLNGEWPEGCNQCKFAEEEGRSSKRQQDMWSVHDNQLVLPPLVPALEYLQLKTGRMCNLKCTICCPACSTSLAVDLLKKGEIEQAYYDSMLEENKWASELDQYKKMTSKQGYYRIDIAGGEPLLNKVHFKWLDLLPNPEKTQLLYNTNGTQLPTEKEINIWKKFKGVWIALSIDSYGEKFESLRVGAKWDKVLYNLKYFQEEIIDKRFNKKTSNMTIVMTLHEKNITDIFDLYDIVTKDITFNNPDPINFNYLYYPEHMSVHYMSKDRLEKAIKIFEDNMYRLPRKSKILKETIKLKESMITFLSDKKVIHNRPMEDDHRINA